jgi:hypothetical protein
MVCVNSFLYKAVVKKNVIWRGQYLRYKPTVLNSSRGNVHGIDASC